MLLSAIEEVEWQPEFLKKNMTAWLENMGDWCISRKRFYGLPLPFYKCEKCGATRKNKMADDDDFDLLMKIVEENSFKF